MKVYFVGSASVGKTTLVRYVSNKYNLPILNEVARTILSEKELNLDSLRSDINVVNSYQKDIFFRQLKEEQSHDSFVADRSALDCIAYSAQHSKIAPTLLGKELNAYLDKFKKKDSFVFFVRPSRFTMKDDGIRETLTWDSIIQIDAMIKLLLEIFDINYFQLSTDSMQERINLINSVLTRF